jgi:dihydroorotase
MIASDGIPYVDGRSHPRSAGTYARILGHYVREDKSLSLMEALRKMSLGPAQRLEKRTPAMRNKGRIRLGADADITVFDPNRVTDRATYRQPGLHSEGIQHVLVNGVPVVVDGRLQEGINPGRPVRAPVTQP